MRLDRHAEVHDLRLAMFVDQHVRRLEVEMNDAEVVDVVETGGDLQDHVVERVPAVAVEVFGDLLSGEELHREVREVLRQQTEVVDLDDARMIERYERGKLRLEAKQLLRLGQF